MSYEQRVVHAAMARRWENASERGVAMPYYGAEHDVPPYMISAPEWAARWGDEVPPVGTVLRWIAEDGTNATHVALCIDDDHWVTTDSNVRGGSIRFESLARMISNAQAWVMGPLAEIKRAEPRPAGDDAVQHWAAQFLPRVDVEAPAAHEPTARES